MPTDLELAVRKRSSAARTDARIQKQFAHTLTLVCLIMCLITVLAVRESPAFAGAVTYIGQSDFALKTAADSP